MFAEIPMFNAVRPEAPANDGPGYAAGLRDVRRQVVFDKSRSSHTNPAIRMGLASTSGTALDTVTFRRTETDRKPPSRVVTAKLLGDPAPDRFEQAEAIRRRVMAKVITLAPVSVRDLLEAISHQPMGANDAGRALGCSPSAASDRAKRAKAMGYLEMSQHRSRTGRLTTYKITASGRAYLAEDGQ